jgi:hypothetical protein
MKKLIIIIIFAATAVLTSGTSVFGAIDTSFAYPPESNPEISWEGQSPYQRDIFMNFYGANPIGGASPTGIPGAIYKGTDDQYLWDSDFVTITGDVEWNPVTGSIGISGDEEGTVTFHFDNWDRDWAVKNFYAELIYSIVSGPEGGSTQIQIEIIPSEGENTIIDGWNKFDQIDLSTTRLSIWNQIQPNPLWEEMLITLRTDNASIYLDQLHVATQCVPVPGAILLGGIGAGFVGWLRRKRVI